MSAAEGGGPLRSVTVRILAAVLVLAVVPLLAGSLVIHGLLADGLAREADRRLAGTAADLAQRAGYLAGRLLDQARADARLPALSDYLAAGPGAWTARRDDLERQLVEVGTKDPLFVNSCAVLDPGGAVVADTRPGNRGRSEAGAAYLRGPDGWEGANALLSGVAIPPGEQRAFLHVSAPVRGPAGEVLGSIRWRYEPAILQSLAAAGAAGADGADLLLVDAGGSILADLAAPDRRGTAWAPPGADGWRAGPVPVRVMTAAVPGTPWLAVAELADPAWSAQARRATRILGSATVAAVGLLGLACIVAARRLAAPVARLAAAGDRIAGGAEERLPAGGPAEIARLSAAMNRMLDALAAGRRDREAAAAEIVRREAFYRGIFDAAPDAVLVIQDGLVIDANPSAERIFRRVRADLLGRSPVQLSPPGQDGEPTAEAARRRFAATAGGEPAIFPWTHLRGDGSPFAAEVSLIGIDRRRHIALVRDVSAL